VSDDAVLVARDGHIATITLNRPDRANALSRELVEGLERALESIDGDRSVRVAILTAAGEKAFCAGADLRERATMSDDDVAAFVTRLRALTLRLEHLRVPVIAAINGAALGGGLELALACDIRIAAARAVLGLPEVRLAIIPGAGGTQRLPRIIGLAAARELILTGRRIDTTEALGLGLISDVVEPDVLLERVRGTAQQIADAGPIAVEQAKRALRDGHDLPMAAALEVERDAYAHVIPTEDRREALRAFAEKRTPQFEGK
jgi:enoyl-CoA hydratase/carnithine racemase